MGRGPQRGPKSHNTYLAVEVAGGVGVPGVLKEVGAVEAAEMVVVARVRAAVHDAVFVEWLDGRVGGWVGGWGVRWMGMASIERIGKERKGRRPPTCTCKAMRGAHQHTNSSSKVNKAS